MRCQWSHSFERSVIVSINWTKLEHYTFFAIILDNVRSPRNSRFLVCDVNNNPQSTYEKSLKKLTELE